MTGITGLTTGSAALSIVPNTPPGELWRYGSGGLFQVAPQTGHYVEEVFSRGEAIPAWRF